MRWLLLPVLLTGCPQRGVSVFVDDGFGGTGFVEGCFEESGAEGLARQVDGVVTVVITPEQPRQWHLTAVSVVSGGTVSEETFTENEATFAIVPEGADIPVQIDAATRCDTQFGETGTGASRITVRPGNLSETWSVVEAADAG